VPRATLVHSNLGRTSNTTDQWAGSPQRAPMAGTSFPCAERRRLALGRRANLADRTPCCEQGARDLIRNETGGGEPLLNRGESMTRPAISSHSALQGRDQILSYRLAERAIVAAATDHARRLPAAYLCLVALAHVTCGKQLQVVSGRCQEVTGKSGLLRGVALRQGSVLAMTAFSLPVMIGSARLIADTVRWMLW